MGLGNKIIYHLKTNFHRYVVFLFSFVMIFISFYFLVPTISLSKCNYNVFKNKEVTEYWVENVSNKEDSFLCLNGEVLICYGNKSINADVFMNIEDVTYSNNLFGIKGELNSNECVISNNIAQEYNIVIGDQLFVYNEECFFKVVNIIDSMSGIDKLYNHKGVIILSYENDLDYASNKKYINFTKNDYSVHLFVEEYVSIEKTRKNFALSTFIKTVLLLTSMMITYIIGFTFILKRKQVDYEILFKQGISKNKFFCIIFFDNFIQFALAPILLILIFINNYFLYPAGFYYLSIVTLSFLLIYILSITFISVTRRYKYAKVK